MEVAERDELLGCRRRFRFGGRRQVGEQRVTPLGHHGHAAGLQLLEDGLRSANAGRRSTLAPRDSSSWRQLPEQRVGVVVTDPPHRDVDATQIRPTSDPTPARRPHNRSTPSRPRRRRPRHRPAPTLDPMPPPHHDPSPRAPSAPGPIASGAAPEPTSHATFTALVRRFAADSPDEWGWCGCRGRARRGRVGVRRRRRRRMGRPGSTSHPAGSMSSAQVFGAPLGGTAPSRIHPVGNGGRRPMHARPDGSLPPSPRWMTTTPTGWLGGRRGPVRSADPARPAPSAARGAARRARHLVASWMRNGARRSTKPRRSTTASGRPSRPGGVGVRLVRSVADGTEVVEPYPVRGAALRSLCCALLHRHGELALVELHTLIHVYGYEIFSRTPVKTLADSLGYETLEGRAERVRRGSTGVRTGAPRHRSPVGPRPGKPVPRLYGVAARWAVLIWRRRRACG